MKKSLCFLLTFIFLIFLITPVFCFADMPVWVISEEEKTITDGQKVYFLYEMPPEIEFIPENEISLYKVTDNSDDDLYRYEYVAKINDDVVYMHNSGEVFVTEEGKLQLKSFLSGEYSRYLYHVEHTSVVDFSEEYFEKFMVEENKTEIDVTTLWNDDIYYIRAYDKTECFAHKCGAVYKLDDGYYYVYYDVLDNSYFDAYGEFSYRRGIVTAYRLTGENEKFVIEAEKNNVHRFEEYIYPEEENFIGDADKTKALMTFIIIPVIFGFIIPVIPLIFSIKFANSKKAVNSKRWYWLTILSLLWIIVTLTIVLLFAL